MHSFYVLFIYAILCLLADCVSGAGNTTCAGSRLDWYTDVVGETPCMTYQRLRQICHSEYEVGSFSYESPGDRCNDQVSTCCCSSIAWALSNLCRNCQWDIDSGSPNGLDAPHGAYYLYRFNHSEDQYCGDGTNQSLPEDIEKAVCNEGIKLENFLYDLFWNTGAWFYTYTRESAETDHAANGNNVYHCSSSPHSSDSAATSSSNAVQVPSRSSVYLGSLSNTVASITIAKTPSSTPSTPSFVTTFETPATIDGTTTTVPYTTTILYATQSGSAIGASAQGGERKSETAAIVGGVVGGVAGLLLLIVLGAWCTRHRRNRVGVRAFTQDPFGISEPSLRPWSPISSQMVHGVGNSAVEFAPPARPVAAGNRALMERDTRAYYAPSPITSGLNGPGLVTAPGVVSSLRLGAESSSGDSASDLPGNLLSPSEHEGYVRRLVSTRIHPPVEYQ